MSKSEVENELLMQIRLENLPSPKREFQFSPTRRFRFDFAWINTRTAVEVEGGTWSGGRHVTGAGFKKDCEKYNLATSLGWRVYRFTSDMIHDGTAIKMLSQVLGG